MACRLHGELHLFARPSTGKSRYDRFQRSGSCNPRCPKCNRGNSSIRHTANASYLTSSTNAGAEITGPHGSAVLGGWQVSGICEAPLGKATWIVSAGQTTVLACSRPGFPRLCCGVKCVKEQLAQPAKLCRSHRLLPGCRPVRGSAAQGEKPATSAEIQRECSTPALTAGTTGLSQELPFHRAYQWTVPRWDCSTHLTG